MLLLLESLVPRVKQYWIRDAVAHLKMNLLHGLRSDETSYFDLEL